MIRCIAALLLLGAACGGAEPTPRPPGSHDAKPVMYEYKGVRNSNNLFWDDDLRGYCACIPHLDTEMLYCVAFDPRTGRFAPRDTWTTYATCKITP